MESYPMGTYSLRQIAAMKQPRNRVGRWINRVVRFQRAPVENRAIRYKWYDRAAVYVSVLVSSILLVSQMVMFGEITMLRSEVESHKTKMSQDLLNAKVEAASSTARVAELLAQEVRDRGTQEADLFSLSENAFSLAETSHQTLKDIFKTLR